MKNTIVTTTEDGSTTLYVPEIEESYHSMHGAIQESRHIFIDAGLKKCGKIKITVFEVGFGTGLNAFLTLLETEKTLAPKMINYQTIEMFPINMETVFQLNYFKNEKEKKLFEKIHQAAWNEAVVISKNFTLTKINADFTTYCCDFLFDVCYFDAFSPEKQPNMWQSENFEMLYKKASNGAILTTYCAKGYVRRALQTVGFQVERLPGPKGKREILRAVKQCLIS